MDEDVRNWVTISEYDLGTAEDMLAVGRYVYVLFACQQALEKMLKALITQCSGEMPPRIHDLIELAVRAGLEIDDEQERLFRALNLYYIETRYSSKLIEPEGQVNEELAGEVLEKTREVWQCLRAKLQ